MGKSIKIDRRDVFHAGLIRCADYEGQWDMPVIKTSDKLPEKLLPFDKAMAGKQFDRWVHFYLNDYQFECVWNNPSAYLEKLKYFEGVISPDFSLYRNMPLSYQVWNTYRNRALGYWLSANGIEIIPNIRWSDEHSYDFCFDGIEKDKTVAVGTLGCIRQPQDRTCFKRGLKAMIEKLSPKTIIVYGSAPKDIFEPEIVKGIKIIQFDCFLLECRHKGAV